MFCLPGAVVNLPLLTKAALRPSDIFMRIETGRRYCAGRPLSAEAVFFGPDTYRFARTIKDKLGLEPPRLH
jgi:hypothetical protein